MSTATTLTPQAAGTGQGSGTAGSATTGSTLMGSAQAATTGGQGNETPTAVNSGASTGDWLGGLSEDLKGYVGNKGWKSPADLVESYRGAEKLLGVPKDRVLKLPEKFYDEKGKLTSEGRAIRESLGAPKEAKDYNLVAPKEGADPKLLDHFRGVFHELGLPKADAEKITSSWNDYIASQTTSAKEAASATIKNQQQALAKDWGAAYEQNLTIAKEAIRTMGVKAEEVTALESILGHDRAAKLFHQLGKQVGEAPYIGGQRPDALLEPVNAKAQIKELISDKDFANRLQSGDREAAAKWKRLHEQAYPGQVNI